MVIWTNNHSNVSWIVTDPSGAIVPNATVTLTGEGTGSTSTRMSNEQGEFTFDFLRVGSYSLSIEAVGFKRHKEKGFQLQAGQTVRRTFALELRMTETVSVEARTPLVNAALSEQLETVLQRKVTELPLSRRNFTNLLQLTTGMTAADGAVRLNGTGKLFNVDGTAASADPESQTTGARAIQLNARFSF